MDGQCGSGSNAKEKIRAGEGRRAIAKIFEGFAYKHERHRVFRDCMELMAIALSNAVDLRKRDEREARYLAVAKHYTRKELDQFCRVLGALTIELEAGPADVLGAVFSELEIHNAYAGQFFTPYEVAKLSARMILGDAGAVRAQIERAGHITVMEPAVGGGAMVIACADALMEMQINYQRHLHVTAVDVDERVAHMAYVQFALLHIPAVVVVGNSLSLEVRDVWYTPAHILGGWSSRLARNQVPPAAAAGDELAEVEPAGEAVTVLAGQLALF